MFIIPALILASCGSGVSKKQSPENSMDIMKDEYQVQLMTVDPGHFHAALVQKIMYETVSPEVYVYAPDGPDYIQHIDRISSYNSRNDEPRDWNEIVYIGQDFFERMLNDKPAECIFKRRISLPDKRDMG